jgi:hypothetical protein
MGHPTPRLWQPNGHAKPRLGKGDGSPVASLCVRAAPHIEGGAVMTTDTTDQAAPMDRKPPKRGAKGGRDDHDRITIRLLPDERAAVETESRVAGLSMASYTRFKLLGDAGPRARRSPSIDAELLAQAVSQLNKAGTNLT